MFPRLNRLITSVFVLFAVIAVQSCAVRSQTALPVAPGPVPPLATSQTPVPPPAEFTVFYDSDPPGAILYDHNNTKIGETPFWAMYELTEKDRQQGFIAIDPTRVVWPSGATATNHPGVIFALKDGLRKTYLFARPDVKGSEEDYAYGLKRLMQRYTYGEESGTANNGE